MSTLSSFQIGDFISGLTVDSRHASGIIHKITPGIGFSIISDDYEYVLVNKFSETHSVMRHFLEHPGSDSAHFSLTKETILFWLNSGVDTKAEIYMKELQSGLIDPMSPEGLALPFKVAPFIRHSVYRYITNPHDREVYLKVGNIHHEDGDHAPLPVESIVLKEKTAQMNSWHLARATGKFSSEPYTYTFLTCGKKLRVEFNGRKESLINLTTAGNTSTMCSPANPFILSHPPDLEQVCGILEELTNNKFAAAVQRLSNDMLHEGIEEAHWEMRRLRKAAIFNSAYTNLQEWVDAAWDEIQARREEDESF